MCCGRERLSWLDDKFESWLERNGPLCPSEAEAAGRRRRRGSALLMLAGAVACLATFVPAEGKANTTAKLIVRENGSVVAGK